MFKVRRVRLAIKAALGEADPEQLHEPPVGYAVQGEEDGEARINRILELVRNQDDY